MQTPSALLLCEHLFPGADKACARQDMLLCMLQERLQEMQSDNLKQNIKNICTPGDGVRRQKQN